jgi:hypothetical protein
MNQILTPSIIPTLISHRFQSTGPLKKSYQVLTYALFCNILLNGGINKMRTLTVSINEAEYLKLGLKDNKISFSELKEKIGIEHARTALAKCHKIARETGLANMTMDEINGEIQAVRKNAKNCN